MCSTSTSVCMLIASASLTFVEAADMLWEDDKWQRSWNSQVKPHVPVNKRKISHNALGFKKTLQVQYKVWPSPFMPTQSVMDINYKEWKFRYTHVYIYLFIFILIYLFIYNTCTCIYMHVHLNTSSVLSWVYGDRKEINARVSSQAWNDQESLTKKVDSNSSPRITRDFQQARSSTESCLCQAHCHSRMKHRLSSHHTGKLPQNSATAK